MTGGLSVPVPGVELQSSKCKAGGGNGVAAARPSTFCPRQGAAGSLEACCHTKAEMEANMEFR